MKKIVTENGRVPYGRVRYGTQSKSIKTVRHGTIRYDTVRNGTIRSGTVLKINSDPLLYKGLCQIFWLIILRSRSSYL
jgi:hypothetical protein